MPPDPVQNGYMPQCKFEESNWDVGFALQSSERSMFVIPKREGQPPSTKDQLAEILGTYRGAAADDRIDIERIELQPVTAPTGALGGDYRRAVREIRLLSRRPVAARNCFPQWNRWFARLSAGGRWIRTVSTA
jgi:hypothetical protein